MTCGVCGGSLRKGNKSGFCGRTPECRSARIEFQHQKYPPTGGRPCGSCGGPTRRDNKMGVCRRTPECLSEYQRLWRQQLLDACHRAYGNACACCGITRRTFLELDHIHNDGAEHRRSLQMTGAGTFATAVRLRDRGWPPGFQFLCANCHTEKTRLGRCGCQDERHLAVAV